MLSENQVNTIAKDIMFDIKKYIEEHLFQYELFLKEEKESEVTKNVQKKQIS